MKRLIIAGLAGGAALLTAGGVAYAVGSGTEPSPETSYVEVVDPSPGPSQGTEQDRDCPEKDRGDAAPDQSGTL